MRIWNGFEEMTVVDRPVVASIGNYDGVHRGHQEILRRVVSDAEARGLPSLLITFDPHPLVVVAPERKPQLLQTRRQKLASLEQAGLSDLLILAFSAELSGLDGRRFFEEILAPRLRLVAVHVGENFRFGNRRGGDVELLRSLGREHGFEVDGVPAIRVDGETCSSSAIRAAVLAGNVEQAQRMLGRPFALGGVVIRGDAKGRALGFPTANLEVENEILPQSGVYVTEVTVLAGRFAAMTNVGVRPTFMGSAITVESHLLGYEGDLYGERCEVRFLARIRDEMRFDDANELTDQLARDRAAAESYFQNIQLRSS